MTVFYRNNLLTKVALSCVIACTTSFSYADNDEWEQHLRAQLGEAELLGHELYSFTQTVVSTDDTKVSTFDPLQTPKWRLVQIDGREPSDKEKSKFEKQQLKEAERREDEQFEDLIKPNSVHVVSENYDQILVEFTPYLKDMADKAEEYMRGEAVFSAADKMLVQLRIYSIEPFAPSIAVKIEQMAMTFNFASKQGQTLPSNYLFSFQGKLAAMKKFDVDSTITYSDYQRVVTN